MNKRALFIVFFCLALLPGSIARAGFGITPPYVRNDSLTQNSRYEQKIILTRSDPIEDLNVEVTVNVPGADSWITVDRGLHFVMPKGESKVPMTVAVDVPKKAVAGPYLGNIRVVISPALGPTPGTVGISLGAQIDVRLNVVDKKIFDFAIRGIKVSDLETGHQLWRFFFPGKINFSMQIENVGNVPYGPTRVVFEIYDNAHTKVVETTENSNTLRQIKPFEIGDVLAELPTHLPPGSYRALFHIYKEDQIVRDGEMNLSILPYGTLPSHDGYGILGLTRREQFELLGLALLALLALFGIIFSIRAIVRWLRRRR